ncbi:serine hydrolase [Herbaspirillum seropedicae]|uniref:Beta-lactamase class C protein n=1 Tax=Herbaspirillum seropedicae (strain SmR1) TaxID=757424 RepID=D8ITL8_HERSS|nr:serine hydrolase [Herbaspirillum seropedicae]ADJ65648.1 beta-lactamase class C protein [Herbaspirillum seropedicae SmR1]AKN67466.1 beta-lactamase [Herbaspirillum seropedicae]AON56525.1 beta-lactamase class C protein [Herbaspirillum seropedicae]NQE32055.1 beta-lactamase [Herbaspirillum seropedicae]UMU23471.1 serine hydrolase [Herbaspirillum seropedicae]
MPHARTTTLLTRSAAALLVLLAGAEIGRRIADLPSLPALVDLQFDITPRSQSYKVFEANRIARSTHPRPWPMALRALEISVPWKDGSQLPVIDFLKTTSAHAFVVIQDGKIVYERYIDGYDANSRFTSFSVAKSFVSALTGVALQQGKIRSLDEPIGHYLNSDEIAPAYAGITIGQLLDMRSGIDVDENYGGSLASPVVRMFVSTDLHRFIARRSGLRFAPGSRFEYRSVDTLVLSRVLAHATGMRLSDFAQQVLWEPLGMEQDASWSVDSGQHGVEKAFCCLNTTARDFARLGLLYLDGGRVGDQQVVSPSWAHEPRQPVNHGEVLDYRDGWWIPPGNADDRDFSAIGVFGQYIYVNPATRTVIVKLSDYGVEQDEVLTMLAMRSISHYVAGKNQGLFMNRP